MRHLGILITFLLICGNTYSSTSIGLISDISTDKNAQINRMLYRANGLFLEKKYPEAIALYKTALKNKSNVEAPVLKKVALHYSALNEATESVKYIEEYPKHDFNTTGLLENNFDSTRILSEITIPEKYTPKLNFWIVIYLFVAMIGFYITVIINFNRKIDFLARILISSFVFVHSFFIFHVCVNISNYEFVYPHAYRMSLPFSFLYGPLLYFYFKRITQQYQFKKSDLLHLVPTVLLLIYVVPIYLLTAEEKLTDLLTRYNGGFEEAKRLHVLTLVALKLSSLIIYGYFIRKLYLKSRNQDKLGKGNKIWNKNLYSIHFLYIVAYSLYGFMIVNNLGHNIIFNLQVSAMALMVLYLGYSANIQPQVFDGLYSYQKQLFFKYEKSGLTNSLSTELMEKLRYLFDEEKIYKENDISLETIAEQLNTTRHNASQVINEHFDMNFHKLINTYRIQEAMSIIDNDYQRNLNIIDIAYEVGYNNKVTFNKAFKKYTKVTPSEYQRISVKA